MTDVTYEERKAALLKKRIDECKALLLKIDPHGREAQALLDFADHWRPTKGERAVHAALKKVHAQIPVNRRRALDAWLARAQRAAEYQPTGRGGRVDTALFALLAAVDFFGGLDSKYGERWTDRSIAALLMANNLAPSHKSLAELAKDVGKTRRRRRLYDAVPTDEEE